MCHSHLLVWLYLTLVMGQVDDQPYCSTRYERLCQGKGQHVGCQFPFRGQGDACENYTAIIFSEELKYFVLHYVNRRRQRIASGHERVRGGMHLPKPQVMMLVQWDKELASLAQRLADQCRFVHDDCRATVRYPYAGQTVGEVRWRRTGESLEIGARRSIGRVLDAWWGERRRVQVKQLISPFVLTSRGAVWGHFSQLAVWTLRAMGCGAVHHGYSHPRLLLVCDFSHTNMLGQKTISPGPYTKCPLHTVRIQGSSYPMLCSPVPDIKDTSSYHRSYHREEDEYLDNEDETTLVEMPKLRKTRPFKPEPEEDGEEEPQKAVLPISSQEPKVFENMEDRRFQVAQQRQQGILREKLNRELNVRNQEMLKNNKAAHKLGISRKENMNSRDEQRPVMEDRRKWEPSRRPTYSMERWEEDNEEKYREVLPLRKEGTISEEDAIVEANRATEQSFLRQRWKQTRNRPRRPGANALLNKHMEIRQQKATLHIDQDDANQLFLDTGFKMGPRTKNS